jgi:glycosyltransferase involved in cell wall biosynthesis
MFITQTIESILNQNFSDVEIIVCDGGSTDNTIDVLNSFKDQIRWFSEKDKGQTDAINKGLRLANGELLGYLNSDDYLLPGALVTIEKNLDNEEPKWVSGDALIVDANSQEIQKGVRWYKTLLRKLGIKSVFFITNYLVQPSTFWNRKAFEQVGFFDEGLHYSMDYDYWFRLYEFSKPMILKETLSAFRIHSTSKGGINYRKQIIEELDLIKRHTNNRIIHFFHRVHNGITILIYRLLKDRQFRNSSKT